ncbi:TROVE domain-containing protein [Streptomonospora wellingtoniae]|uniref:TROVE domain-containing protein n=1 Tax=Streptomonospora wellingtoniae TaxID=3075544 RepID=A0ABU2KWT3_9ACTN|nr:TROVE domain-containing protein [Streptomonospora sp. DSM 45055]MDT0303503.1 TROVE domain-containing protein [Streptomonospora sp. DSM 45055]
MAKFNTVGARPSGRGPIAGEQAPSGRTHEGAPGYARDTKSELFLLAVANMVGEQTFYEGANERDARFRALAREAAVADPEWFTGFVGWLRGEGNMRTGATVAALEGAKARLEAGAHGHSRQMVTAALQRADEPGEALAYWTRRYGRSVPKPVKRGIADAVGRLYDERSMIKYDTGSRGFRFSDVLNLVHASPESDKPWQGHLFQYAHDRRHGRGTVPDTHTLPVLARNLAFGDSVEERADILLDPDELKRAGMTWEAALSMAGDKVDKAALWEALIPSMGYMALLRNLRNFDQAGVSDEVAQQVAERLADSEEVAKSRQFPMRFLAAYRNAPSLRWGHALDKALQASLGNVPELGGSTLVLVDRSGSMQSPLSARSDLNRADAAATFGAALAMRCASADLVEFGTRSQPVHVAREDSLLRIIDRFSWMGGTNTADAVRSRFRVQDRVVIVTDEQARGGEEATRQVPETVPVYTWNLAGYRYGHGPSGEGNRHTFGGLSDAAFRMIPLIGSGQRAAWPWESRD